MGALGALALTTAGTVGTPFQPALRLGLSQLSVAGAVLPVTARRATKGSSWHLAGSLLAVLTIFVTIVAPSWVLDDWALVVLLLGLVTVVGLVSGRR